MHERGITTLFLDIGGVLLSNGWDRNMRRSAAEKFGFDLKEMDERHHLSFDAYEEGELTIDEYLYRMIFYEKRSFTITEFKDFMFAQSEPRNDMIDLITRLKRRYNLKTVAVSNEGRELTIHRVKKFNLDSFIDFFVSSCFVHLRKPEKRMYMLALDCAQVTLDESVYIDDRKLFVEVAEEIGFHGIHHTEFETTYSALYNLGLSAE